MRRDVCYFLPADTVSVYKAYLAAATNQKFRRECKEEPYHTISFGLNYSMKFNMNGGSCTLHFMPYNGGTAVDMRFSIAQLYGARYEAYARELTDDAMPYLGVAAQLCNISIDEFLKEENKIYPHNAPSAPAAPVAPAAPAAPVAPAAPAAPAGRFCANCGRALGDTDAFCAGCGTKAAPAERFCSNCGAKAAADAAFCASCGTKL